MEGLSENNAFHNGWHCRSMVPLAYHGSVQGVPSMTLPTWQ